MAKKAPPRKSKRDHGRRTKKKVSVLTTEKVDYIDYKDVNLLKRFMSCLLYTSPSPRDQRGSRMPSSA